MGGTGALNACGAAFDPVTSTHITLDFPCMHIRSMAACVQCVRASTIIIMIMSQGALGVMAQLVGLNKDKGMAAHPVISGPQSQWASVRSQWGQVRAAVLLRQTKVCWS